MEGESHTVPDGEDTVGLGINFRILANTNRLLILLLFIYPYKIIATPTRAHV